MASDPQEPDKYSLDEMMNRLRSRGIDSEPELVTRSDGTQAYRVRKRKRRSRQPHKIKQERRQKVLVMQIGALVVLAMLLVTGAIGLFAYYNSSSFANKLRGQISEWTGAEVDLSQFRTTPVSASSVTATLRWPENGPLRELKLKQISADLKITSFVSSRWIGEEVMAHRGVLELGATPPGASPPPPAETSDDVSFPFSFIRYRCRNLTVLFGQTSPVRLKCRDMEASFYRLPEADQLRINSGTVATDGWPELPVERGLIEFNNGKLTISSLRIGTGTDNDGFANIAGTIDPRSDKPVFLDVTLESFPLKLIGGKKLARMIEMRVDSKARLSFVPGQFDSHELVAPFDEASASKGVLVANFPFLRKLAREFQDDGFGLRPFTTEAEGVLRRNSKGITLEKLRLTEKSFLALRGEIHIERRSERISGHFDVGVPERLAGSHPSDLFRAVFARDEEGFRWARIALSGTVLKPDDDFDERVREAAETAAREKLPGATTAGTPASNDDLEKSFRNLIDQKAPKPDEKAR